MSEDKTYTEAQVQELIQTRTAELRESRNALTAEVAQLRPAVADWEKKAAGLEAEVGVLSAVQSQLDDLRAKHAASEARWGQDRVLLGAGIDDEDAAGVLRSRYVAAEEPGDFAAWFEREGRQIPLIASFISTPTNGAGEPPAAAPTEAAPPNMPRATTRC